MVELPGATSGRSRVYRSNLAGMLLSRHTWSAARIRQWREEADSAVDLMAPSLASGMDATWSRGRVSHVQRPRPIRFGPHLFARWLLSQADVRPSIRRVGVRLLPACQPEMVAPHEALTISAVTHIITCSPISSGHLLWLHLAGPSRPAFRFLSFSSASRPAWPPSPRQSLSGSPLTESGAVGDGTPREPSGLARSDASGIQFTQWLM